MQLPLLSPESNWRPLRVTQLPSWTDSKRVAIDVETNDKFLKTLGPGVRRGAYIAGFSFALEDGPKHYVPLRHAGGDNVEDPAQALGWLREQAKAFEGEIVGANLGYDLDFLAEAGIEFPKIKRFRDVQVAEPLIDELQSSFSLESICNKYLGIGKDEALLREAAICYGVDPKKDLHLLPARYVGAYAEADAALPLLALRRQEAEIEAQELWPIYNMESDLLPVLVRMRRRGVLIDQDKLDQIEQWSRREEQTALDEIYRLTSCRIGLNTVWQASALVPALVQIGVNIPLTPKTKKPSIDKAFLASVKHPVAEALNRARRVNKVRTTFVNTIREHMTNGRIHCIINQLRSSNEEDADGEGTGGRFGRCSSNHPNMQQAPARDPEIGPMWRSVFVAEPDKYLASIDFSSQEPRQTVHYAASIKLGNIKVVTPRGANWVDADASAALLVEEYIKNPRLDQHQWMADLIKGSPADSKERKRAKDLFLGICYGMGGPKLCRALGLPTIYAVREPLTGRAIAANSEEGKLLVVKGNKIFEAAGEEGQRILDRFSEALPFVAALSRKAEQAAKKNGYVRTMAGRKCRFPKDIMGNYDWTWKALNRAVQAGAADQTKIAMVELDKQGYALQLQIHDEILASVNSSEEAEQIGRIMETCYQMKVPSVVDVACVKHWGEVK